MQQGGGGADALQIKGQRESGQDVRTANGRFLRYRLYILTPYLPSFFSLSLEYVTHVKIPCNLPYISHRLLFQLFAVLDRRFVLSDPGPPGSCLYGSCARRCQISIKWVM
eukprot:7576355-Pyramimonas_sp.AAC.2